MCIYIYIYIYIYICYTHICIHIHTRYYTYMKELVPRDVNRRSSDLCSDPAMAHE